MKDICDCFLHLISVGYVNFFTAEGEDKLIMPHIPNTKYRYNVCPCCKKEVRDIEIDNTNL